MGITHLDDLTLGGDLILSAGSLTMSGGVLDAPTAASAPASPTTGNMYYDTTLEKFRVYQTSGWTNVDGTSAGSLDAAYNGGAAITVDAGAVTLNDALTTNQGTLLIDKSGAVTGSASANLVYIYSDGAHDTSGTVNMLKMSMTGETATTPQGIDITMGANTDNAIMLTKGAMTLTDGAVTLTSGALTLTSGNLTLTSGNLDVTGTSALTGNVTLTGTLAVSGASTLEGAVIIDGDNAEQFLIRENADAADVLTVDTTQDAGDTTMLLTTKVTTGDAFHIDAQTITTGSGLKISIDESTMTTGYAIEVYGNDAAGVIWGVKDDGTMTAVGTAEGTDVFTATAGDVTITDGDLTISGGEVVIVDGVTTSGSGLHLTSTMTTAGAATGTAGALTIIANAATTGTVLSVVANAVTSGDMLYLDNGGGTLSGGFYINCNDDNTSDFTVGNGGATVILGAAAGTTALTLTLGDLVISDTDASTISSANGTGTLLTLDNVAGVIADNTAVLSLDAGGAIASGGNILRIAPTGTPNAGAIGIEFVGAGKALNAMFIDADPTANDVATINGGGALTNDNAVLTVSSDGALATGGNTFRVETTGTPASGAIYTEFDYVGLTDTNENIGVKIDAGGKKVQALHVDADPTTGDVVYLHSDAVIASDKAVINVTSAGAVASGGNVMRVDVTGTPASGAVYVEYDFAGITDTNENVGFHIDATSKKVQALVIDAAPLAGSAVLVTTTGALAADKASLEVVANVTGSNADSSVVRVNQEHTGGASFCMTLKQDDLDVGFLNFEGTSTADANSPISSHGTAGATTDFVRCALNGAKIWIAVSTNDPSA